ncbi:MAG: F0F1 ATP synthase subunit epsilon [Candidatus Latescibacterota bacterium]
MSTFHLEIVTPERTAFAGSVQSLRAPGSEGDFGVLRGHARMIAALRVGPLHFLQEDGQRRRLAVGNGVAQVRGDGVAVLVDSAEFAEEIDVARASAARDRARQRLQQRDGVDVPRAQAALARSLTRLAVAGGG